MSGIRARFQGRLGGFRLDAELTAPAVGVTALYGPSGSGKTSLLRCIAGLERMAGTLSVRGEVWQDGRRFLPAHRRPVGFVFQEPSLMAHLSVKENLLFGYRRTKVRRLAVDEVISLLALSPLLGRSTTRLSGGERQRVAIGRALLSQPELMLMDEPLSSLDREAKAEILPYLERLHETLAIPMIYVSHDVSEIARLADHLLVMSEGRIVASRPARPHALAADLPDLERARERLAGLDAQQTASLALAALIAGLEPARSSDAPKSPG